MKRFALYILVGLTVYSCATVEPLDSGLDSDALLIQAMIAPDNGSTIHHIGLRQLYAIDAVKYYNHSNTLAQMDFNLMVGAKDVDIVVEVDSLKSGNSFNHKNVYYKSCSSYFNAPVKAGDELKIRVESKETGVAESQTMIPEPIPEGTVSLFKVIDSQKDEYDFIEYSFAFRYHPQARYIGFSLLIDGAAEPDFKMAEALSGLNNYLSIEDGVLKAGNGMFFMDASLFGDKEEVLLSAWLSTDKKGPVKLRVYSFSEEAFRACQSERARVSNSLSHLGMVSPITVWTNVRGGQGYFCGYNYRDFDLTP